MKAAVYHGAHDIRIEDVPDPQLAPGELLLEIHAAGICGTDVGEYLHGPASYATRGHEVTGHLGPLIPGHEFSGRVVAAAPDVEGFEIGTIVASGAGISCGRCYQCLAGRTNLCVRYSTVGLQRHGALAEFCAVPASTCVGVDAFGLDEETAALGQPMAIGVHAFRRGRVRAGDEVVVVGAGGIGVFLAFAAAASGASVTVVDLAPERLELATALGAVRTVRAESNSTLSEVLAEHGLAPAAIYEVTGSELVLRQAFDALPPGGRLVVVGLQAEPRAIDLRSVTLREIELVGTNAHVCGDDLPEALRLLASRRNRWTDVAPTVIPLSQLVSEGLEPMAEGRSTRIKTLVDPWADRPRRRAER